MTRYQILEYLEGRYIRILYHRRVNGEIIATEEWRQVKNGRVQGQYNVIVLSQHDTGMLEVLARESQAEVDN